jgi:hypothetical protein
MSEAKCAASPGYGFASLLKMNFSIAMMSMALMQRTSRANQTAPADNE